jgi:predicted transcriptional regulator
MLDILKGLEPRYERVEGTRISAMGATRVGSARRFLDAMAENMGLWKKPLHNLAEKASQVKVKHFVQRPTQTEIIDEQASLDAALHQLIIGHHQSLLVTRNDEIVGILRLTDVYERISEMIKSCKVETPGISEAR